MSFEDDLAAALQSAGVNPQGNPGEVPPSLGGLSSNQNSGKAILLGILRSVGLDTTEAATYVSGLITGGGSISDWQATLTADLYDPSTVIGGIVKQKYPSLIAHNDAAVQAQQPTLTVGDYLSTKQQNEQLIEQSGLAPYVDKQALADKWIVGFTSPVEAKARIDEAQQYIFNEPPEVRAETQRLFGVGDSLGAATAYYLDPATAVPKIQQQRQAAEIAGSSVRSGFGLLTAAEATQLAQQGISNAQAQQGFGVLAGEGDLFAPLPGSTEDQISRDDQLGAAFSNSAAAQRRIANRKAQRLAEFQGGSGFGTSSKGVGGLGSAAQG